eukprot:TRINITY_DN3584_c0_g1_i1.p1 TRINITY_DN3584_c0_g1~~TRINITY_DN3584_c0_g1_i1.p1  ORF type:complete len:1810 (-),score=478.49 TRINITY_DN3584_c0_g1_i1:1026-5837(-)
MEALRVIARATRVCSVDANAHPDIYQSLLRTCADVLRVADISRDCAMYAGLAIPSLLAVHDSDDVTVVAMLPYTRVLLDYDTSTPALAADVANFSELPQLALLRGMLSTAPQKLLVSPIGSEAPICVLRAFFGPLHQMCVKPTEALSRLFALQTLQFWLNALVAVIKNNATDAKEIELMFASANDVLALVWNFWDDAFRSVGAQVRQLFDNVLDLFDAYGSSAIPQAAITRQTFLSTAVTRLLDLEWSRKAKSQALTLLVPRVGASALLAARPDFFEILVAASEVHLAAKTVPPLWMALLRNLQLQYSEDTAGEWRRVYVPQLAAGLLKGGWLQSALFTYVMDDVFREDAGACNALLTEVSAYARTHGILAATPALISILATARPRGQWDWSTTPAAAADIVTPALIAHALLSDNEEMRMDALQLVAVPRSAQPVLPIEDALIRLFLTHNMKSASTKVRSRTQGGIKKFMVRVESNARKRQELTAAAIADPTSLFQLQCLDAGAGLGLALDDCDIDLFLQRLFVGAMHPSGAFQRRMQALNFFPCHPSSLALPCIPAMLINTFTDPFDANREFAYDVLLNCSAPLSGFSTPESVSSLAQWALRLLAHEHLRQRDGAAATLRLIAEKYVRGLKWKVGVHTDRLGCVCEADAFQTSAQASVYFIEQLVAVARAELNSGAANLGVVHGVLLSLRYIFNDLDFGTADMIAHAELWRPLLAEIVKTIHDTDAVALNRFTQSGPDGEPVPSMDGGMMTEELEEVNDAPLMSIAVSVHGVGFADARVYLRVQAWLSIKESSLLAGVVVSRLPLDGTAADLLSIPQLMELGDLLQRVMLSTGHTGVIEKTSLGFSLLCRRLLHAPPASLNAIPAAWSENMLSITENGLKTTILRRSAGLPFCFLAIFNSEPSRHEHRLLNIAIPRLLHIAMYAEADTTKVHAMNVLRSLFRESSLAVNVQPFVERGLLLVMECLQSKSWMIRNSAMMMVQALSLRCIGARRVSESGTIAPREFFARCPSVLAPAKAALSANDTEEDSQLFAMLLLLSQMSPAVSSDEDVVSLLPLVAAATRVKTMNLRMLAARAVVSLVSTDQVVAYTQQLITSLPASPSERVSMNIVHGTLLQLYHIMALHVATGSDDLRAALTEVLTSIQTRLWLASSTNRCALVRNALLRILDEFVLENAMSAAELKSASIECALNAAQPTADTVVNVGVSVLRTHALGMSIRSMAAVDLAQVPALLEQMLRDDSYDVRRSALKHVLKLLTSSKHNQAATWTDIAHIAMLNALRDTDEGVLSKSYRLLRLLAQSSSSGSIVKMVAPYTEQFWSKVADIVDGAFPVNLQREAVAFMGLVIQQTLFLQDSGNKMLTQWIQTLVECASPDADPDLRYAVCDSLAAAQALLIPLLAVEIARPLWLVVIDLLQDEDDAIRSAASSLVSATCDGLSLHPPSALQAAFVQLSKRYGSDVFIAKTLLTIIVPAPEASAAAAEAVAEDEAPKQLSAFEPDTSNTHSEETLCAELAVHCLEMSLRAHPEIRQALQAEIPNVLQQLRGYAAQLRHQATYWPGGISYDQVIFRNVHRLLLAMAMFAALPPNADLLASVAQCMSTSTTCQY